MQIRQRGKTLTLVRTVYDPSPEYKRGRSITMGRLSITDRDAPPELLAKLTEKEREQLEYLLARQRQVLDTEARERAAKRLAYYIRLATEYYLSAPKKSPELTAMARDARDQWTKLLSAMVDAGVGRTRKRRAKTSS